MDPGICPHCGGGNPYPAINCQWCGTALPPRPLPTAASPEFLTDSEVPDAPYDEEAPVNVGMYVRIAVVVIVLIILAAVVVSSPPQSSSVPGTPLPNGSGAPNAIHVSIVLVTSPDNACGLNGWNAGGFSGNGGMMDVMSWWLPGTHGSLPCSVTSVTTNTTGFSLSSNLPIDATSGQVPLLLTAYAPGVFTGVLNLTFD